MSHLLLKILAGPKTISTSSNLDVVIARVQKLLNETTLSADKISAAKQLVEYHQLGDVSLLDTLKLQFKGLVLEPENKEKLALIKQTLKQIFTNLR